MSNENKSSTLAFRTRARIHRNKRGPLFSKVEIFLLCIFGKKNLHSRKEPFAWKCKSNTVHCQSSIKYKMATMDSQFRKNCRNRSKLPFDVLRMGFWLRFQIEKHGRKSGSSIFRILGINKPLVLFYNSFCLINMTSFISSSRCSV